MIYRVEYYPQSGPSRIVDIEADSPRQAIEKLADDPQHPLAQVLSVTELKGQNGNNEKK